MVQFPSENALSDFSEALCEDVNEKRPLLMTWTLLTSGHLCFLILLGKWSAPLWHRTHTRASTLRPPFRMQVTSRTRTSRGIEESLYILVTGSNLHGQVAETQSTAPAIWSTFQREDMNPSEALAQCGRELTSIIQTMMCFI